MAGSPAAPSWPGPRRCRRAGRAARHAQWQRKGDKFDLVITANKPAPQIPAGGKLKLLS